MEGAGWSWRGLHLTQRSHFSIKLVQAGQALQGLKPAAMEVGENMPRCRRSQMRRGQNEELGYPGSHSQYCSRWAGQHGTSGVTGKKAQSKRNLNFVLIVTTGRKNVLAETVNFLCWMKKSQNQNPKKQPLPSYSFEPSGTAFATFILLSVSGERWPQLKSSCPRQWE